MADGPISPEGSGTPVAPESKEASPKKGVVDRLFEAQHTLRRVKEEIKEEFLQQVEEFSNWTRKEGLKMPIIDQVNAEGYKSVTRRGVWSVEGEGAKRVEWIDTGKDTGTLQGGLIRIGEDMMMGKRPVPAHYLTLDRDWMSLSWRGIMQEIDYDRGSGNIEYSRRGEPLTADRGADILDYSRETLNFLKRAKMQPAAPSQPATGQPTTT